jgi:pimeloyl-ACP methyl ester carboxylesterase
MMRYPDDLVRVEAASAPVALLDAGAGRPVLLLHGFTFNAHAFRHQLGPLVDAGFRPLVPDAPGLGRTPLPERFAARAEDYASLYVELLDALDIRGPVDVVGHSLGGGMALMMAWKHPERVSSLLAIAPAAEPSRAVHRVSRVASQAGFEEVAPAFFTRERLVRLARSAYAARPPPDDVLALYADGVDVVRAFGVVGTFFSPALRALSGRLDEIHTPTLVVTGDADPHVPPERSRCLALALPDARLAVLDSVGHCPHEEAPERFDDLMLSFLLRADRMGPRT